MNEREIPISDGKGQTEEEHLTGGGEAMDEKETVTGILEARVKELEEENESLRDQRIRAIADLDNVRRRAEQDLLTTIQRANERLLMKLLPIIDDFERSVENGAESLGEDPFFKGVEMIKSKLAKLLDEEGVERIEAVGKPFDVELHEALMRQPSDQPENTVVSELEPGYTYKGKVLRHAKVIVSA